MRCRSDWAVAGHSRSGFSFFLWSDSNVRMNYVQAVSCIRNGINSSLKYGLKPPNGLPTCMSKKCGKWLRSVERSRPDDSTAIAAVEGSVFRIVVMVLKRPMMVMVCFAVLWIQPRGTLKKEKTSPKSQPTRNHVGTKNKTVVSRGWPLCQKLSKIYGNICFLPVYFTWFW